MSAATAASRRPRLSAGVRLRGALVLIAPLLMACAGDPSGSNSASSTSSSSPTEAGGRTPSAGVPPSEAAPSPTTTPDAGVDPGPMPSDGTPRRAVLTIPAIDLTGLVVVPYEGWTDDAPGTAIQNRGSAASPNGARGGTGPGGVGNYQVTAHRLSSTRAFELLPRLQRDDRVHVVAGGVRYTYRITQTRETSFRSPRSLREQRAAVPGRPGVAPTRAMLTLSTCATPEDHAVGNYWADEFDNPEHRIDKIGVLVASRRQT